MKLYVYSVRDKKLGAFGAPKFANDDSEHMAEGVARDLKRIKPEQISEASDCSLYYLGQFDDISGKFELLPQPEKLIDYEDYVPRKSEVISHETRSSGEAKVCS